MANQSITIGQYIPGDSFIHSLDPRSKLAALILIIMAIFSVTDIIYYIPFILVLIVIYKNGKIPMRFFLRGIRPVTYIAVITFIIHLFFTKGGEVLLRLGFFTVEWEGLFIGTFTVFRLMLLVFYTMIVTLTTTPLSLTAGMEFFLRPLKYLKVPVGDIAMILTISLRFIPTLIEESGRIVKAQKARGLNFEGKNIITKIRYLIPVVVPLFISAFRRADELAVAMEARCYRVGEKRTRMHELSFTLKDYALVFLAFFTALLFFFL